VQVAPEPHIQSLALERWRERDRLTSGFVSMAVDVSESMVAVASCCSISSTTTPTIAVIAVVITLTLTTLVTHNELFELIEEGTVLSEVTDLVTAVAAHNGGSIGRFGSRGSRGVPIGAHERKIGVPEGDILLTNELATERIVLRHGMESGEERDLVELLLAREVSGSNANDTVASFLDAMVRVAIPFAGNHADRKEHHPCIEAETRVLKNMVFLDSAPKAPSMAPLMGMAQFEVEVSSSADHETECDLFRLLPGLGSFGIIVSIGRGGVDLGTVFENLVPNHMDVVVWSKIRFDFKGPSGVVVLDQDRNVSVRGARFVGHGRSGSKRDAIDDGESKRDVIDDGARKRESKRVRGMQSTTSTTSWSKQ